MSEFSIVKNVEESKYQFVNGRVRGQAPLTSQAHALAHRVAERFPELASRAWKAAEMVDSVQMASGRSHHGHEVIARVTSSNGKDTYTIAHHHLYHNQHSEEHFLTCDCYDFVNGKSPQANGQAKCKHIIAVQIVSRLTAVNPQPAPIYQAIVDEAKRQDRLRQEVADYRNKLVRTAKPIPLANQVDEYFTPEAIDKVAQSRMGVTTW